MELKKRTSDQIFQFLKDRSHSISSSSFFLMQIRLLLEINFEKEKYKITYLYCNWLLHKNLTYKNNKFLIDEISNSFDNYQTKKDLIRNLNKALSIKEFVNELKEIIWRNIQDRSSLIKLTSIENDDYWKNFIRVFLNQVSNRPVLLQKGSNKITDLDFTINGIQIVPRNDKFYIELISNELENKEKKLLSVIGIFE